jgi:hypothetical protein
MISSRTRSKFTYPNARLLTGRRPRPWITASRLYNFVQEDPALDVLKHQRKLKDDLFKQYLFNCGNKYEEKVLQTLRTRGLDIVSVAKHVSPETLQAAKALMDRGTPYLHSVPVKNPYSNTGGIVDLLVRSDHLRHLTDATHIDNEFTRAVKLHEYPPYHYVVVDIKYSVLPFTDDGIHLQNIRSIYYNKCQLYVYNQAVGYMQGYIPPHAYLLGKSGIIQGISFDAFYRLGRVTFADEQCKETVSKACSWLRRVIRYGSEWDVNRLSYNMKNGDHTDEKKQAALAVGEITLLWGCTVRHREMARALRITSFHDPRFNSSVVGFKGRDARILDTILQAQRTQTIVRNGLPRCDPDVVEVYFAYETFPHTAFDIEKTKELVYMVGILVVRDGIVEEFKQFGVESLSKQDEVLMLTKVRMFLSRLRSPPIFCWKMESHILKQGKWEDLYSTFLDTPIGIPGVLDYHFSEITQQLFGRSHPSTTQKACLVWEAYVTSSPDAHNQLKQYNRSMCEDLRQLRTFLHQ